MAGKGDTLERYLWDAVEKKGAGLISLTKQGLHPQPAVAFVDWRRPRLWLATAPDTELVRSIGAGGAAMFSIQGEGILASIGGELTIEDDPRRLARLCARRKGCNCGPTGSCFILLRLECVDADVSLAEAGLRRFTWDFHRRAPPMNAAIPAPADQPTLH